MTSCQREHYKANVGCQTTTSKQCLSAKAKPENEKRLDVFRSAKPRHAGRSYDGAGDFGGLQRLEFEAQQPLFLGNSWQTSFSYEDRRSRIMVESEYMAIAQVICTFQDNFKKAW